VLWEPQVSLSQSFDFGKIQCEFFFNRRLWNVSDGKCVIFVFTDLYLIAEITTLMQLLLLCYCSDWPRVGTSYYEVCGGGTVEPYCTWTSQLHCCVTAYCWNIQTEVPLFCEEHRRNGPALWSVILSTCSIGESPLTVRIWFFH